MNKALIGLGFGLVTLLVGLALMGQFKKEEAAPAPALVGTVVEGTQRNANLAKIQKLSTALRMLEAEKGGRPEIGDLTEEALGGIPEESFSKSKQIVGAYDGTGGWVYREGRFSVNHPEVIAK